jgi:large subunit ribosomal protein L28
MSRGCCLTKVGVLSGHRVSHSERKTSRKFLPNLQRLSLESGALGVNINLRIATRTLRTINKYGSLDSFLVNFGYNKLSQLGRSLRKKVIDKLTDKKELDKVKIVKEKKKKQEFQEDKEQNP